MSNQHMLKWESTFEKLQVFCSQALDLFQPQTLREYEDVKDSILNFLDSVK